MNGQGYRTDALERPSIRIGEREIDPQLERLARDRCISLEELQASLAAMRRS